MDPASKYPPGDFSFLDFEYKIRNATPASNALILAEQTMLGAAYRWFERADRWTFFDCAVDALGHASSDDPERESIARELQTTFDHSGPSLSITLRVMRTIRKSGWTKYVADRMAIIAEDF